MKRIVVSETESGTWNYHLRVVGENGIRCGGGLQLLGDEGKALCGALLGWDTEIPVRTFGMKSHIPERWCKKCAELKEKMA